MSVFIHHSESIVIRSASQVIEIQDADYVRIDNGHDPFNAALSNSKQNSKQNRVKCDLAQRDMFQKQNTSKQNTSKKNTPKKNTSKQNTSKQNTFPKRKTSKKNKSQIKAELRVQLDNELDTLQEQRNLRYAQLSPRGFQSV